jgi:hypothetical protein
VPGQVQPLLGQDGPAHPVQLGVAVVHVLVSPARGRVGVGPAPPELRIGS